MQKFNRALISLISVFLVTTVINDSQASFHHNFPEIIINSTKTSLLAHSTAELYQQLEKFLSQQKLKKADRKTYEIMLKLAKREDKSLDIDSIENFPCSELRSIDKLWVKYSDGKYGFSVQKEIYQNMIDNDALPEVWKTFSKEVGWWRENIGWVDYQDLFAGMSPRRKGIFPRWGDRDYGVGFGGASLISYFAQRLLSCEI
ncbi:GUN4 domain-containing protein [Okeania sp. SIO1I7]|uniref:GUN4 domain-containing protein n=1 Tax=Okeania sp. SIO1I7 TaxID=2607772 RepID=UPI0013FABE81|nr:GUN4 domain-containing protein [Okeania sp. SIO1I7]NET26699.1 GUN4 domain-containing protein [Okeania sp. SIO1I7]